MTTTEHPELDKLRAAREEGHSDAIGAFIDWLGEQGYVIAKWQPIIYRVEPRLTVCNQSTNQKSRAGSLHRAIDATAPALCGALPEPFTPGPGAKRTDGWHTAFTQYVPVLEEHRPLLCPTCERMYEAGEWPERESQEPHLMPIHHSIETWLSTYFGIDQAAVERERRAILDSLQP